MGMGTGVEMGKVRIVDKNEHVDKGTAIYEKIKDKLEPEHKGEFVAIEVDTGDYFLGKGFNRSG